jgi:hypothetical protein
MPSPYSGIRFRKGDDIMKTWFIFIATIFFFGINGVSAMSKPESGDAHPAAQVVSQALVQIVRTWERQAGSSRVRVEEMSLGTVIGPHLILTHNHFTGGLATLPNETLSIVDNTGRIYRLRAADVKPVALDKGTLLFQLPVSITLTVASLAEQPLINQLAPDDWLTVNYWDDTNNRLATKAFQFIQMKNGVATLADPEHVINPGDSGGSVYFAGRFIGNTWSYNADTAGNSLGSFNVALVPAQITEAQHTLD